MVPIDRAPKNDTCSAKLVQRCMLALPSPKNIAIPIAN